MRKFRFFLLYLFCHTSLALLFSAPPKTNPVISKITIHGSDIFDFESNPSLKKFPYTVVNFLHIRTRELTVQRELLFKVGDRMDPFLLRETERNLRALSFIRSARVAHLPQRDGTVSLVVFVSDSWTTEPQINLGGRNGIQKREFGFKEKNLFGFGKTIEIFYEEGVDLTQRRAQYTDPRLLGSRWRFEAEGANSNKGETRSLSLQRPFYSADTKWSSRLNHIRSVDTIDEYIDNVKVSTFEQTKEINEVGAGIKLGSMREIVSHAGLRFKNETRNFDRTDKTSPDRGIPERKQFKTVFLDMDSSESKFTEFTHLEKMTRIEDANLGTSLQLSPGISPNTLTGESARSELQAFIEKKFLKNDNKLTHVRLSYSGRDTFREAENELYETQFKHYYRQSDRHTLVGNIDISWSKKLDSDNQIKLGSENGLRAFSADSIVGTKSFLFNLESRWFFIDDLWDLVSIGSVAFYDTGYVWGRGQPISLSRLRGSIGTGLRLGLTRSSNEVIVRFDVGYRIQRASGDSPLVFTFGTGQAF